MAAQRPVKYKYSVKEVVCMLADSDEELSDDDFESDAAAVDSEAEVETDDDHSVLQAAVNTPVFDWQEYPDIDVWDASWLPDFQRQRGVLVDTSGFDPVNYFKLFFSDAVFELMAIETNRYAEQFFDSPAEMSPHSRVQKWKPTTPDEMKGFVALQIEMGLDWRYRVSEHWSTRSLLPGGFTKVMTRDRYLLIQSFLHFNDSSVQPKKGEEGYNPMYKVQTLLNLTVPRYRQLYQSGRDLSVDESMIKYKGRLAFRQYMPDKPTKYGIKDFVLAESDTGFCLKFMTYTGKYSFHRKDVPLTTQVVLDLLDVYEHAGHVVHMDNFYTSPELFRTLESKDIGACGTARSNRKHMPNGLKPETPKLKRGDDPVFFHAGNLVACGWEDVKRVTCLSTVHTNNTCEKTIRQKGSPTGRQLNKPVMIEEYNYKMSGVDHLDQMLV